MVEDLTMFALRCKTPWAEWTDPGSHRVVDPSLNTAVQADSLVQYNFKSGVYKSREHVKAAVIGGLHLADRCFLTVLFAIPFAVLLLQCTGVGG